MQRTVVAILACLLGAAAAARFPTDISELREFESALHSKGPSVQSFSEKDLEDPDKLTKLAKDLEQLAHAPGPKAARRQRNKRQLFLKRIIENVNGQADKIGRLVKPVPAFLGVDFNNNRDHVNAGYGTAALALGLVNKHRRSVNFNRMHNILEHKFHLNSLFLDSINKQNSNAEYSGKVLKRVARKVVKTRKAILGKIHASINPLN